MTAAAIAGVFSDYKLVRTRSVIQIIVEIPVEQQADVFRALGYPMPGQEINVAVARMNSPAGTSTSTQERTIVAATDRKSEPQSKLAGEAKERRPWNAVPPSEQAGMLCDDKAFWKYVQEKTGWIPDEQSAAVWLREELGILSRRDLEGRPDLAAKLNAIREQFLEWAGRVPVGAR